MSFETPYSQRNAAANVSPAQVVSTTLSTGVLFLRPDAGRGGHVRVELPLVHARDDAHFADAEPLGIAGQRVRRGERHPVGDGTNAHVELSLVNTRQPVQSRTYNPVLSKNSNESDVSQPQKGIPRSSERKGRISSQVFVIKM